MAIESSHGKTKSFTAKQSQMIHSSNGANLLISSESGVQHVLFKLWLQSVNSIVLWIVWKWLAACFVKCNFGLVCALFAHVCRMFVAAIQLIQLQGGSGFTTQHMAL